MPNNTPTGNLYMDLATGKTYANEAAYRATLGGGTTPPPPGSTGNLMYNSGINPNDQNALDIINNRNRTLATEEIDPNAIYQRTLSQYQSQIDAINNIYNDQLNNSRIKNAPTYKARADQNRIGQVQGGLVSSPMGGAQTDQVNNVNAQEQAAAEAIINDRRAQELAAVHGQIRQSQEAALKAKYEAQRQGSDAVLAEINQRPAKKQANLSNAVKALLAGGHDPSKMSAEELNSFTTGLGVTKQELQAEYNSQQAEATSAKTKADQDAMKALPSAAQEYEYAKKNGYKGSFTQYQNEDANRKARATGNTTTAPKVYTIKAGDTFFNLANSMGLNLDYLLAANPAANPNNLKPGQVINLPTSNTPTKTPTGAEVTQFINQQMATPEFKNMSSAQKKDFILANGGTPSDYGY